MASSDFLAPATAPAPAAPAAPASSASAQSTAATPIVFRNEAADVGFPWGGAVLLVLLAAVAVAARWRLAGRSGRAPAWLRRWAPQATGNANTDGAALCVESSARLDAQTQVHAVRWGERRVLLATGPQGTVLLDRAADAASISEEGRL